MKQAADLKRARAQARERLTRDSEDELDRKRRAVESDHDKILE